MQGRKYYEAYDERYKTVHEKGIRWFGNAHSSIVTETISKYNIDKSMKILEIGCGEGRDAQMLLDNGFCLLATDISPEAITYCKNLLPAFQDSFEILDCIAGNLDKRFDFIYAVAVVHMLVPDQDRNAFYQFVCRHLTSDGIALICTMGDGKAERQSDINTAFELQEREYEGEPILMAGTSCRIVNDETFMRELAQNGLELIEKGQTSIPSVFSDMMYAVVKRHR